MARRNREYVEFLKEKFNEQKYIEFINDLLNLSHEDINTSIVELVPHQKQFKETIEYYKFIANYTTNSDKIGIFIVKLSTEISQNARTAQRSFVSTLLSKYNLDASIVAFYQDNESSWRLSFVKKELSFTETGIKVDLSPAKRYSYLVGENETVHTAQEYLFKLFEIEDRKITLSDIEKVFDVEKVTKKFFEEYKEKYLKLKEYLDSNEDFITESKNCDFTSEEFAKKLMGQIVFLYFLQKKGWLGVQLAPNELQINEYNDLLNSNDSVSNNLIKQFYELKEDVYVIDKNKLRSAEVHDVTNFSNIFIKTKYNMPWGTGKKDFIRTIYKQAIKEHKNFFDSYVEQFFYNGLNEKRDNQYFALFNCKIPFLNGGLFEPLNNYRWSSSRFSIPNDMFSNEDKNGILDFLDLYNFTIDEEEPLEKEIAVDPEMLGKIFENLLDVKDRKSKGAFYTPREIVHYMCQESLANYLVNEIGVDYNEIIQFIKYGDLISQIDWEAVLDNKESSQLGNTIYNKIVEIDKALMNVKVADPAVGSGAFPLGILNEIVKLRNNLTTYMLIQSELGKLNLDEIIDSEQRKRDIYDIKLQTIENCIYAVDIENSAIDIAKLRLWLSLIVDYPNDEEPQPLPNLDCKIMQGNSLLDEFEGVPLFSKKILKNSMRKNASKVQIQQNIYGNINDVYVQQSLHFDSNEINFNEYIDKVVLLQKQYFSISDSKVKRELKEKIEKIQFGMVEESLKTVPDKLNKFKEEAIKKQKPWFIWELEFYDVFKDNDGFDIVIGNPPYVSTKGVDVELKNKLAKQYGFADDLYYHFIIKGLTIAKQKGIVTMITPDTYFTTFTKKGLRKKILENKLIQLIDLGYDIFESAMVSTSIIILSKCYEKTNIMKIKDVKGIKSIHKGTDYEIPQKSYNEGINNAFYIPNEINQTINNKLSDIHMSLMEKYWSLINTSKNISKYSEILAEYREHLKPGDITLVGLISEGGQGLATGNNGKYLGVKESSKEAEKIRISRARKLDEFNKSNKTNYIMPNSEKEIWSLFDSLKEKYGRDIFGQGYIFKIVDDNLLCNISSLTKEEKINGINSDKCFVPYDKGDKDGNRWFFDNPFVIEWNRKNVAELKQNAGKKGPGGSRFQNSQFYFREGFCYMDVNTYYLKSRYKGQSIHDVMGMSFFPLINKIPSYYLVCLINSEFVARLVYNFLNNTSHFQINDCRMLPIPVPDDNQLLYSKYLYDSAENIQRMYFAGELTRSERDEKLHSIQTKVDFFVKNLYNITY